MLGITQLAATTAAKPSGFNPSSLILILVVVVAFYLLMIRPQQRRRQQAAQQKNTIQPGARVRTTAGMYATVVDVDGDDVVLEIAPGIEVRYMKRAVMDVVSPGEAADEAPADEADAGYYDADSAADADDVDHEGHVDSAAEADDVDDVDDTPRVNGAVPGGAGHHDPEETAYEQATGIKKD